MTEQSAALVPVALGATRHPLALASQEEFELQLRDMQTVLWRVQEAKRALMTEGADFGTIPGTPKPTIYKPGVEKLCGLFRLAVTYEQDFVHGDDDETPAISVRTRADVHAGSADGPVIAQGVGEANSWEVKHRYRKAGRVCPACSTEGTIRKSKAEYGGGWWCTNCSTKFDLEAPAIVAQTIGRAENQDPYDLVNTLVKMSKKRAQTDGVLTATCSSDLFTQDVEDFKRQAEVSGEDQRPRVPTAGGSVRPAKDAVSEMRAIIDEVPTAGDFPALNGFIARMEALRGKVTQDQWDALNAAITERARSLRGEAAPPATRPAAAPVAEQPQAASSEPAPDPIAELSALATRAGKVARTGNIWLTDAVCQRLGIEQKAAGFTPAWIGEDPRRLGIVVQSLGAIVAKKEAAVG